MLGVPDDLDALCVALLAPEPESRGRRPPEILRRLGATPSDQAPGPAVSDAPDATHLIGREPELRDAAGSASRRRADGRAVAVRVGGLSGLGKSVMVHHFLDGLDRRSDVLVLRGRAY